MTFPRITTPRLILREIKNKDIFAHSVLFSDKETMELFGGYRLSNDLGLSNVVDYFRNDFDKGYSIFWVITLVEEMEFIGFIELKSYNSSHFDQSFAAMGDLRNDPDFLKYIDKKGWEIDYALLKKYRGKGIMTEATQFVLDYCITCNLSPIYAKVNNLTNLATIGVLKRIGFVDFLPQINEKGEFGMMYKWTK